MILSLLFIALSLTLSVLFFLYGFNHYYLLDSARRYRSPALPAPSAFRPSVCVHLPIYNERYVVRRLAAACIRMADAYGKDKVRILILDDSDDETKSEVDAAVREYAQRGFSIEVIRRDNRGGFKAGALQAGLQRTGEEFIAIFDADFIPPEDFLLRTVPFFEKDDRLGIIQTRWTHLNKDASLFTRAVSHAIDVHFLVEQPGRYASGNFLNFNGSGGVLRKKAILESGGWQADTLAEDLDLSYRMQSRGYRILFLRDVPAPGEIPPTIPNFKQQQSRWACGALRVARKILPGILRDPALDFRRRWQAFLHLTGYMIQPLMVMTFALTCIAALAGVKFLRISPTQSFFPSLGAGSPTAAFLILILEGVLWLMLDLSIVLCTLAPWMSLGYSLKLQNLSLWRNLPSLLVLLLVSFGISLSVMYGVIQALFTNRAYEWTRTPKYFDPLNRIGWQLSAYQIPLNPLWVGELGFVLIGLWAMATAIRQMNYNVLFILIPFTMGYALVLLVSILQSRVAKVRADG